MGLDGWFTSITSIMTLYKPIKWVFAVQNNLFKMCNILNHCGPNSLPLQATFQNRNNLIMQLVR